MVIGGGVRSSTKSNRAMLPSVPDPSTACTPMVFSPSSEPSVAKCPGATWTVNRPAASVESVPGTSGMSTGLFGSVRSISWIRTTLPKAVWALTPLRIGSVSRVTGGTSPVRPVSLAGASCTESAKTIGARRMAKAPRPKVVAISRLGPVATLGRPVVGSTLPRARSRSRTSAIGKPPPPPGGFGVVFRLLARPRGTQPAPPVVGRAEDPAVAGDVEHRVRQGRVGRVGRRVGEVVGDDVPPVDGQGPQGPQLGLTQRRVAERVVRDLEQVAGDVGPGRARGQRVGDVVDAARGDGVGLVAAAVRVGHDRPDRRAVEPGGDVASSWLPWSPPPV